MTNLIRNDWMRASLAFLLVAALAFGLAAPVAATEFIEDTNIVIGEDEVIEDDLFLAGESIEMNGTVQGDLFAFGQLVEINGTVEGNLIAAGSNVRINGIVHGTVFGAGSEVLVAGEVGGSLFSGGFQGALLDGASVAGSVYFGGYSFDSEVETSIERNLYMGGYQLLVAGSVGKDVNAGLGAFELTGTVGDDVRVEYGISEDGAPPPQAFYGVPITRALPNVAPGVDVEAGTIGGEFEAVESVYDTPEVNVDVPSAEQMREAGRAAFFAGALNRIRERVGEFIGLLIVAALVLWLAREPFMAAYDQLKAQPLPSFAWGLGSLVAFPFFLLMLIFIAIALAIFVSFVTLGELTGLTLALSGTAIGSFVLIVTILAYLVGKVLVGYVVGQWLLGQVAPSVLDNRYGPFWAILLGVFLFELLRAVPLFGWMLGLVVVSFGFGAVVSLLYARYRASRMPVEAAA